MANYKPAKPFHTPLYLYKPEYKTEHGRSVKTYPGNGVLFWGSFITYGGTEREINGVYIVEDTANVETWYNPDIKSGCGVALAANPEKIYEIIGEPENIEQRNMFCKFKVKHVKGGA